MGDKADGMEGHARFLYGISVGASDLLHQFLVVDVLPCITWRPAHDYVVDDGVRRAGLNDQVGRA